jgi:hypothetical protein
VIIVAIAMQLSMRSVVAGLGLAVPQQSLNSTELVRWEVRTTQERDLTIESVVFSPLNPLPGATIDITVTVRNVGTAPVAGFHVALYVDPDEEPPTAGSTPTAQTFYGLGLNPNSSFQWTRTGQAVGAEGVRRVFAWVDPAGAIDESNTQNNLVGPERVPVGPTTDAFDPEDNVCTGAIPIEANGFPRHHRLSAPAPDPDEDWSVFTAQSGVRYRILAQPVGADADVAIRIYHSCTSFPSLSAGEEILYDAPVDGPVYIQVMHKESTYGPDTAYHLSVLARELCTGYFEPNNSCNQAVDIGLNQPQLHTFCCPHDQDWIRIATQPGVTYHVEATNVGADADVEIAFTPSCDSAPEIRNSSFPFTAARSGAAYLRQRNRDPTRYGEDTQYQVTVRALNDTCQPDAFEPDDTPANAPVLEIDGAPQTRTVCPINDRDWARVEVRGGVTYTFKTTHLGPDADPVLCLFAIDGVQPILCDDDSGGGLASRIVWQAPTDGTYLLRVQHFDPMVAGDGTRYDLSATTQICEADEYEPDNGRGQATPLVIDGFPQQHNFCPLGDQDWFRVELAPGEYLFETNTFGSVADTVLTLYDAQGSFLAENDDFGPGTGSEVRYISFEGGVYYLMARSFNPQHYGGETEYAIRARFVADAPPPPPPPPTPDPTPQPVIYRTDVRTLILANPTQLATLHGQEETDLLMEHLELLAAHELVRGEIVRLDANASVSDAYERWNQASTRVDLANEVASTIRNLVLLYREQREGLQHLILVGDDRALPMRRIADNTPRSYPLEQHYFYADPEHTTGAALQSNFFLTDDYYANRLPMPFFNREIYIPELAVGRLIESSSEIRAFIDHFLANPTTNADHILVTGYDFVIDSGEAICAQWQTLPSNPSMSCELIGSSWPGETYRAHRLGEDSPFKIQSINGHAEHFLDHLPGFQTPVDALEVAASTMNLAGGLIYTPGCHAGLNVPPENPYGPLDLPQAFIQQGANYIGNSGYGWGSRSGIALSERLMVLLTEELQSGPTTAMGRALMRAKQRYFQEEREFNGFDEKVAQQLIFYGLPMYQLATGSTLSPDVERFPSVEWSIGGGSVARINEHGVMTRTMTLKLAGTLGADDVLQPVVTEQGTYFTLDGSAHFVAGQPIQPRFYTPLPAAGLLPVRSALLREAEFLVLPATPAIETEPVNEFVTPDDQVYRLAVPGWYPANPVQVRHWQGESTLVALLGQSDPGRESTLLLDDFRMELYFSADPDVTPPIIDFVDAVFDPATGEIAVKVDVNDPSGVAQVVVTYNTRTSGAAGVWRSLDLVFDEDAQKWSGAFVGDADTRYFVQAVDNAGNLAQATNKGRYYLPGVIVETAQTGLQLWLPYLGVD